MILYEWPEPVKVKAPANSTCFEEDTFTIPFRLEVKRCYALWLHHLVFETKRVYGPYEYKWLVNFLRGTNPELPKDKEYRKTVVQNVQFLIQEACRAGVRKEADLIAYYEACRKANVDYLRYYTDVLKGTPSSFKRLHERMCLLDYNDFRHLGNGIRDGCVKDFELLVLEAIPFDDGEWEIMNDIIDNTRGDVEFALLRRLLPENVLNISDRLCHEILTSIEAHDAANEGHCSTCGAEDHVTDNCKKRKHEDEEKAVGASKIPKSEGQKPNSPPKTEKIEMVVLGGEDYHIVNRRYYLSNFVKDTDYSQSIWSKGNGRSLGYGTLKVRDAYGNLVVLPKVYCYPGYEVNMFAETFEFGGRKLTYHDNCTVMKDDQGREIGRKGDDQFIRIPLTVEIPNEY